MHIREATDDDLPAVVALMPTPEELFRVYPKGRYPLTVQQLRELRAVREAFTVVVEDNTVVAFANLYDIEPGRWGFIGNVVVSPCSRGRGIGRRLVEHMMAVAQTQYGLPDVRISVVADNTPALLLYTALGFDPYAVEQRESPVAGRVALLHMRVRREAIR